MTSSKPHPTINIRDSVQRISDTSSWHSILTYTILFLLMPFCVNAQIITTFAGGGTGAFGDGGPATAAKVPDPAGGTFDKNGNYYCAEPTAHRIRKISNTGIITTIAGNGTSGFSGDNGPATAAQLNDPYAIILDSIGNFYIADENNSCVRRVDVVTGIITTIVGTGLTSGYGGDNGPATNALLSAPTDLCFDKSGNLYVADELNHRIRKIDSLGIITTIAGGIAGYAGDNGPATAAKISLPNGLALDDTGNLYVAGGNVVRKINSSGIITTVAGVSGSYIYTNDGMPATTTPMSPVRVAINLLGQLIIADNQNYRVYNINTTGICYTIAGNGLTGYSGDGVAATATSLDYPSGVSFDACGNLYVTEVNNKRIRKVTYPPTLTTPTLILSGITNTTVGTMVTVTANVTNAGSSYNIEWFNRGIQFTTTTVPYVTYTKGAGADTITAKVVSTATYGCYDSTTSAQHIITADPTGITRFSSATIAIYPNPANDIIHIDGVITHAHYSLSTIVGTVLLQGSLTKGNNTIPIHSLPTGIYIIEVNTNEHEKTITRFTKQ